MGVAFWYPTKAGQTSNWQPTAQPVFPIDEPQDYEEQLSDETSGGELYVQDKGGSRERFELTWNRLSTTDKDSAKTFFGVVKKSFNTFEYEDIDGTLHTVRWMNSFNFRKVREGRWAGSVELRKQ